MTYEEKYKGLYEEVAKMLVSFKNLENYDHGDKLLHRWDSIRNYYDNK